MPDPTSPDCCGSGCCRRSGFWLCSQACLREGVTQAKGWEMEGKGSQLETCGPPLEAGAGPRALPGLHIHNVGL